MELFAVISVSDYAAARPWYEQLLGELDFEAHATEGVWKVDDGAYVAVHEEAEIAGGSRVTMLADDLEGSITAIAERGLEPSRQETYDNGVRKIIFRDADGNELGFAAPPDAG